MARSGFSAWAKKNQCHQAEVKRTSHRSSASMIGTPFQYGQVGNSLGMVHRRAESRVTPAIISDDGKAVEAHSLHQRDAIAGLRALRRPRVIRRIDRLRGLPEAPEVRTDYGVVRCKKRHNPVPCRMCTWVPVQERNRGAEVPVADTQHRLPDIDEFQLSNMPGRSVDLFNRHPCRRSHRRPRH